MTVLHFFFHAFKVIPPSVLTWRYRVPVWPPWSHRRAVRPPYSRPAREHPVGCAVSRQQLNSAHVPRPCVSIGAVIGSPLAESTEEPPT